MLHNEGDRWLHVDRMQPGVRMAASPDAKHLVDKTLAGDLAAFDLLVRRHRALVHGLVQPTIRRADDVEDVLQDVFHKAYRELHTLQNRFAPWLARIAAEFHPD